MKETTENLLDSIEEGGLAVDVEKDNYQCIYVPGYHNAEVSLIYPCA
jgi:hypothetical protein